ncbi:hypothetical protein GCM10009717_05940 [Agromyces allii]|uniref:DUF222 domain-containing protein n=1 Tax=Agromyces allii TaxID=393607 RepID=A0ABP5BFR3_9MICO
MRALAACELVGVGHVADRAFELAGTDRAELVEQAGVVRADMPTRVLLPEVPPAPPPVATSSIAAHASDSRRAVTVSMPQATQPAQRLVRGVGHAFGGIRSRKCLAA